MPEWWSYSLSDFLLFSPRTYYRLIERHNLALWPAHLVGISVGLTLAVLVRRPSPPRSRAIMGTLAVLWAWVGWAFVARRYASINWAAVHLAWLFAAEALLLGWLAVRAAGVRFAWTRWPRGVIGGALAATSAMVYPLLAPALGRGWSHAEVFGIAPDPTALGTLGLLLLVEAPLVTRIALLGIPALWCLVSGATLWAMGSPETWIMLVAPAIALTSSLSS
jgi:Family of unknown function (DUF6064)